MVDAGRAELDGEPHARAGAELVAVHPQPQPGGPAGVQHGAGPRRRRTRADAGSQKTSTHRAYGAQAREHRAGHQVDVVVARSAYSAGTTCAPRNVVSAVTSRGQPQRARLVARR